MIPMPDDPDTDAFNRAMDANRRAPAIAVVRGGAVEGADGKVALWSDAGDWSEGSIPPRPWIVPGYLMRGAVTVLAGPPSAGKSSLCVAWAVSLALGLDCGEFRPRGEGKALLYNVEDDADEQQRRISAALRPTSRSPRELRGNVVRCGPAEIGTLLESDKFTGGLAYTPTWLALDALIAAERPDLVVLDPLIELHTAEENDNAALRLVMGHCRALATRHRCSVLLVHHTKKGSVAGDMDAIRGAGSIIGAGRAGFTAFAMSKEEAEALGIPEAQRRHYVRVDSVKGNYAPPAEAAWHELQEYTLDNGETVPAIIPWTPPAAVMSTGGAAAGLEALALIEAAIARGTPQGPYSPRLAESEPRSIAPLLAQHGVGSAAGQKATIRELLKRGVVVAEFKDRHRRTRTGFRTADGAPVFEWLDQTGAKPAQQGGLYAE